MIAEPAMTSSVVVIMAKDPAPGRTKTRLTPPLSPQDAARLYEAMLGDTITLVSSVRGVRLALAITPASALERWRPRLPADALLLAVDGATVGVCLSEATRRLFDAGFSHVIAINSDGPTLPPARIEHADVLLEGTDVVLGPSDDGGYYLIGVRHPWPGLFSGINWSTAGVMAQTLERVATLGRTVALLESWYDIDTAADVERLQAELTRLPADALPWTRRFFADTRAAMARGADARWFRPTTDPSRGQEIDR